jgi:DNA-binding beta-propeller fold protein YncE
MLMLRRFVLVLLAGVMVLGVLGASSASAFLSYPSDGQLAPAQVLGGRAGFGFLYTGGVAVNGGDGDTYVVDAEARVVDVFATATDSQLAMKLEGSATPAGSFPSNGIEVAANNGTGDVYVLDSEHGVVDVFNTAGSYVCQITGSATPSASECNGVAGSATPAGGFSQPRGIAVDQATGEVYVGDASNGAIDVFGSGGEYLRQILFSAIPGGGTGSGVAVDDFNGHVYVANPGERVVYEFDAAGAWVSTWTGANTPAGSFGGYVNVAVDNTSGRVYVASQDRSIAVFESSGAYVTQFDDSPSSSAIAYALAVDQATGVVYVANDHINLNVVEIFGPGLIVPDVSATEATGVLPTEAVLHGTVNPDGTQLSDCHFDYGTSASFGQSAPCVPAASAIPTDSSDHAVSANVTGLEPGTTYYFRLVAANGVGCAKCTNSSSEATFATLPRAVIDSAQALNLTASTVDLHVQINPRGLDTTYHFEYGTSTGYGTSIPVPDVDIGAGVGDVAVSQHVVGLQAGATYHWRVVAHNANGTTTGVDHTFVYSTGGVGLPDNRAYEMVTPPMKNAALIGDTFGGIEPDIAEDGSRVMMASIQCFGDSTSCPADDGTVGTPFAFTRSPEGWAANGLAPSATQFDTNDGVQVNANTDSVLFRIRTPLGGELDWYARHPDGSFVDIGPYASPKNATTQTGTADLSRIVYQVSESPPLYEYVGVGNTAPMLVGVSGGAGSTDLISACGTVLGSGEAPYQAMSGDGRTVFFTARACASGSGVNAGVEVPADELFARVDESRTVSLSQRSPLECTSASGCLASSPGNAMFVGAADDGSKAFFLDTQRLTDSASEDSSDQAGGESCERPNGVNGCNLYEYDFSAPAGRNLVAVSAGDSSGGGPRVQGVLAVSADGSHVYFVARGVLTGVANERGQLPRDGAENMYVFERDAGYPNGQVAFIASVPESDDQRAGAHGVDDYVWQGSHMREDVTPDGRFLVFTSGGTLTADDTSSTGAVQVFRYDALTGALVRISSGENGFNDNGNAGLGPAGIVAPGNHAQLGSPRGDPTMSHDGSFVFFESPVGLTPGALNNVPLPPLPSGGKGYAENVYEWHEGHVYLISDGRDANTVASFLCAGRESGVCLLGADATGRNVFFLTADPLVAADKDLAVDVYDARVCSASEPCIASAPPPPVGCQGEGCHGTPAGAPALGGAATVTFSGPGNLAPPSLVSRTKSKKKAVKCVKGKRAKHGKCVKKRKGKRSSAKRAKSTRGGKK